MIATLAASAALMLTPADAARREPPMPAILRRIGVCETHLNWRHSTRDFATAFGLYRGTYAWGRLRVRPRPPINPVNATPRQQVAVALAVARQYGWSAWGCYRFAWVRNGR